MRRKIIPYNPKLKVKARELRKNSTFSEILLWGYLSGKQVLGYDFDMQRPIDNFIVDFYCKDLRLAVEVDGESHHGNDIYDARRDKRLNELGVVVMRFDDIEVLYHTEFVIQQIEKWILENQKSR